MSSSIFLLTNVGNPKPFDAQLIREVVRETCGAANCRESDDISFTDDLLLDCRYSFAGGATNVSVPKDLMCVTIEGTHDVSLNAALAVQRKYEQPLFAVLAHAPDSKVELSGVKSVDELRQLLEL